MTDENGQLEHRTRNAIGRIDKRLKKLERATVTKQQLEDLLQMVKTVESLVKRVGRIENSMIHFRDMREAIYDNQIKLAQEMAFIRERVLLKLEAGK